jgi:hypothetical protein
VKWRSSILVGVALVAIAIAFLFPLIPQSEAYHNFADQRTILGIPHCFDVLSNVFFLIVGLLGMRFVLRDQDDESPAFVRPLERWPYLIFFASVALTAFGSAYYHLHPDDQRLVWDRIPIMFSVMALLAATIGERICVRTASWLLGPLLLLGAYSPIYWEQTQVAGHGDLRAYGLAQYGSLLVLLLLVALFAPRYTRGADLLVSLGIYGVAKLFEAADRSIFSLGGIVSGHTLKHVAAALSAYWILRMLRLRKPVIRVAVSRS